MNFEMQFRSFIVGIVAVQLGLPVFSQITPEPKTVYTAQQFKALNKFRNLTNHILQEDVYYQKDTFLMRWLSARDMDVDAASEMIHNAYKWRKDNHIDSIVNEKLLHLTPPPYVFEGFDKEGRPIVFFTPTAHDLRGLLLSGRRAEVVRTYDQMLERGYHALKNITTLMSNGEEVLQFIAILDMTGFNLRQHFCLDCLKVYRDWQVHYENYYPDALKYFVVINVNRIAVPFIEFLRPFMSKATQRSLKVFDSNKKVWSKFLREIISEEQLPYRFGGTKRN